MSLVYYFKIEDNIACVPMANLNSPHDSHTRSEWAQYNTGYPVHSSSHHQLPTLHHRATGQLNVVAYPATPLTGPQTQYPQQNQSPNISYWKGAPALMHYQNYYPQMSPPPRALPLTLTPLSWWSVEKISFDRNQSLTDCQQMRESKLVVSGQNWG